MAYRRRHTTPRSSTFEDIRSFLADEDDNPSHSIAANAIRASAAHRDSSHSAAYNGHSTAFNPPSTTPVGASASADSSFAHADRRSFVKQGSNVYEYSSMKSSNPRHGFWDVLAKKAKAILEDDKAVEQFEDRDSNPSQMLTSEDGQVQTKLSPDRYRKTENCAFQKEAIASNLKEFGGMIETASDEGTRRSHNGSDTENPGDTPEFTLNQLEYEEKINASKKVANAMAAKAKLLLQELKTVKADLMFIKERSTQLEEANKALRENRQKGDIPADDDMIRHQLETMLEEKARLAHENCVYARENRFLRETVEYHQLTMQDVVDLDEDGTEEDTEVYPIHHQMQTLASPSRSTHDVSSSSPPFSNAPTMPPRSHASPTRFIDSVASSESPKPPTSPNRIKKSSPSASPKVQGPMEQHQHISSATPP